MLTLKGKTIRQLKKEGEKEEKKKHDDGQWVIVVPRMVLTQDGWGNAQGNWYSPNRATSGGYHFHLVGRENSGWIIIDALFYTHAQNAILGGLNIEIELNFEWMAQGNADMGEDDSGRMAVTLAMPNQMNRIHQNQRIYLDHILQMARLMPLDHLNVCSLDRQY